MDNDSLDKTLNEMAEKAQQVKFFWQGVFLGLFYGIVGNMLVSHYYPVFTAFVVGKFDVLFWWNLLFPSIIGCILFFVSWKTWHKMNDFFNSVQFLKMIREADKHLHGK